MNIVQGTDLDLILEESAHDKRRISKLEDRLDLLEEVIAEINERTKGSLTF